MKILFLVNTYYPLEDGVALITRNHAEGLAKKGHKVTVFTPVWKCSKQEDFLNGVKIQRFNIGSKNGIFFGDIKGYVKSVVEEANSSDCLVAVALQAVAVDPVLSHLKEISCRKILYMHGMWDFKWHRAHFKSPLQSIYKIWANTRWRYLYTFFMKHIRRFDCVIHLSEQDPGFSYFKKHGVKVQSTILNAVDDIFWNKYSMTNEFRDKYEIPLRYAICVSNYIEGKNQKMLLEAFSKTKTKDVFLVCIGSSDNEYRRNLLKTAENLGLSVKLLYGVPRSDIPCFIQNSQFFILGSLAEKQPVCIFEAMASSVPFISTNVGDVLGRPGGIVVNSIDEMVDAIDFLSNSSEEREKLAKEGYEFAVANLSKQRAVDELEKIITG